jgi:hypothetical protein
MRIGVLVLTLVLRNANALPLEIGGFLMPECTLMYMDWCLKNREGKTGMAMNGGGSWLRVRT